MIHFTVGSLSKITSLGGALRHFGVSATLRRRIKQHGICTINGKSATTKDFVHEGDEVCVTVPEKAAITPEPVPFSVLYEDDYLLVVDKPAGILMHQTSGERHGTLANGIMQYYKDTNQACAYHPMHRLDRNTSGLCMIAKEPQIQYAFDKEKLSYHRLYLALLEGAFPGQQATVRVPIGRAPDSIIKRCVTLSGKEAHSDFTCLAKSDAYSLALVRLHTGRTHQIRVHSAYLGHPLVGDDLYGGSRQFLSRQGLHAYCMQFVHPVTRQLISVNSPLPPDMERLVLAAGWNYIPKVVPKFTILGGM